MSQPNLYARVRTFFVHIARETAGAACTRSSLRPRYRERAERDGKLGQIMSRECEAVSSNSLSSPGLCAIAHKARATQYAAAHPLNRNRLWNTGSPAFAGDDTEIVVCACDAIAGTTR